MINDDTFTALATIWDARTGEIFAAQNRHMDRMANILEAVGDGIMSQADGVTAAQRSQRLFQDRMHFLGMAIAQKLSDELGAWLAA